MVELKGLKINKIQFWSTKTHFISGIGKKCKAISTIVLPRQSECRKHREKGDLWLKELEEFSWMSKFELVLTDKCKFSEL